MQHQTSASADETASRMLKEIEMEEQRLAHNTQILQNLLVNNLLKSFNKNVDTVQASVQVAQSFASQMEIAQNNLKQKKKALEQFFRLMHHSQFLNRELRQRSIEAHLRECEERRAREAK